MWLRRIYDFLCIHSNPIWKGRNCRDYRPPHLTFREYFRPLWFSRSCVVVAYCNRRMRNSNVQGFVSTVPTLYEEKEDYAPLYRNRRMRSSIFTLHSSVSFRKKCHLLHYTIAKLKPNFNESLVWVWILSRIFYVELYATMCVRTTLSTSHLNTSQSFQGRDCFFFCSRCFKISPTVA